MKGSENRGIINGRRVIGDESIREKCYKNVIKNRNGKRVWFWNNIIERNSECKVLI
jgi:hypothetical protein